jgi:hypothetical protein
VGLLVVQSRVQTNKGGAIGANIVLVGAKLAALGGDSLKLLLSWGIGVSNVHWKTFFTNTDAVELPNDLVADITRIKSKPCQGGRVSEDQE